MPFSSRFSLTPRSGAVDRAWRQVPLLLTTLLATSAMAAAPQQSATGPVAGAVQIDVNGVGELQAEPDVAVVAASYRQQGSDSKLLVEQAAEVMASAIQALRQSGVAASDIAAGQLQLNQRWRYLDGKQEADGFEVVRSLTVHLDDINLYPATIALLTQQGVNGFDGVTFEFSTRQQLLDQATQLAVADAVHKAGLLGRALSRPVCQPQQVSLGGSQVPRPRLEMAKQSMMAADNGGYNPGEQSLRVEVTATFACAAM